MPAYSYILDAKDAFSKVFSRFEKKGKTAFSQVEKEAKKLDKGVDLANLSVKQLGQRLESLKRARGIALKVVNPQNIRLVKQLNAEIKQTEIQLRRTQGVAKGGIRVGGMRGAAAGKGGMLGGMGGMGMLAGALPALGVVGAVAGITAFAKSALDAGVEFEKLKAVLTTTLGSGSAAERAIAMIDDFSKTTTFSTEQITSAFVHLAARGFVPTKKEMTKMGDLAASMGKDFDQLAEAMIDAQVGEFERLKEFGVTAKSQGDKVSFTFKGQTKTIQKTDKAIREYLLSLGEIKGVAGSMEAASKTIGGQIDMMKKKWADFKLKTFQALRPVFEFAIKSLGQLIDIIPDIIAPFSELKGVFDELAEAWGPLIAGFQKLIGLSDKTANSLNFMKVVTFGARLAIRSLVTAFKSLMAPLILIGKFIQGMFVDIPGTLDKVWAKLKSWGEAIGRFFKRIFGGVGDLLIGAFTFDTEQMKRGLRKLGEAFTGGEDAYAQLKEHEKKWVEKQIKEEGVDALRAPGRRAVLAEDILRKRRKMEADKARLEEKVIEGPEGAAAVGEPEMERMAAGIAGGGVRPTTINVSFRDILTNVAMTPSTITEGVEEIENIINKHMLRVISSSKAIQ